MTKETTTVISPIAIDLGAKNTGVYFAHYEAGSSPDQIAKQGKVYQLEKDKYTLLMEDRTASRHQRRGYDRKQMAKRLFKLIWEKHLKLEWDEDVQQTISFLLNRRGFSFLTEEYDTEVLRQFPQEAHELLPEELKIDPNENGEYDFDAALVGWVQEEGAVEKIKERFDAINQEPKRIKRRQVFIGRTKKLRDYCQSRINKGNEPIKEKRANLSKLSRWILEEWHQKGVQGLPPTPPDNNIDLVEYLNEKNREESQVILDSLLDVSEEERTLKNSQWNFKVEDFNQSDADFMQSEGAERSHEWLKTHLNHLAFAIYKTLVEVQSGGRHRSKYFKEVKEVLSKSAPDHTHGYLKNFCGKLSNGGYKGLDVNRLHNFIGHISNLELKPLRKFFNWKEHRGGDCWDEQRLTKYKYFEKWILDEWRINPKKDKYKAKGAKYDYKKLREKLENNPGSIIGFWLETDPNWTIPPYQDNNNRRPPKCQSLVLNPAFLDKHYSEWREWLKALKDEELIKTYLGDYEARLRDLESSSSNKRGNGTRKPYFGNDSKYQRSQSDLDARVLQFIFDRVKAEDPLNLNEIYSHTKKYRQKQSTDEEKKEAKEKLKAATQKSDLPEALKTAADYKNEAIFKNGTFLHLVCRYYKQRQRARDGRIFIHPQYRYVKERGYENTGRFDDKKHLLAYCNHKSRQKRYQSFYDIAGVLQISPADLEKKVGSQSDEKLIGYLKEFRGLKKTCADAAEAQKNHKGFLKSRMRDAISKKKKNDNLYKLNESIEKISKEIGKNLFDTADEEDCKKRVRKFCSVFSFAQIHKIAFLERSGNANTCVVCSMDNAQRMQMIASNHGQGAVAKAQRLPAIPTRLIDGGVMRMARVVGGAIAKDKWSNIKNEFKKGNKVCVPIIIESNRFEFEPSLKVLKGKPLNERDKKHQKFEIALDKDKRIEKASQGICPYTGDPLSGGDKDHIIPRSSNWGTLNDEANLIWASDEGNKTIKQDKIFSLQNLGNRYKKKQFDTTEDSEIEAWIIEQIWDAKNDEFKFGPYRNFINLSDDEQKAFRHALFLVGHPLREKVIIAIDNRTRTFVNGTQRYFAQVLADKLYKESKSIKKQHLLSFDYFGVEALDNTRGDGVYNLRQELVKYYMPDLMEYDKEVGQPQKLYSHLIDAQVAFCMMADAHREEGGLKLNLSGNVLWSRVDRETGERTDDERLFKAIQVIPEKMETEKLERRKPDQTFFAHRSVHRDNIYAERYVPILVHKEKAEVRIGFSWQNSTELEDDEPTREKLYFSLQFNSKINGKLGLTKKDSFKDLRKTLESREFKSKTEYFYIPLNVRSIHAYYIENYNTAKGFQEHDKKMKFLRDLAYRTEKKKIETLEEAKKILSEDKKFQVKVFKSKVTLPIKKEWERLANAWEKTSLENDGFLRRFFGEPDKQPHEKVRKVFSLPIKTGEGKILLKRGSWNGKDIFQIVNDSDSRRVDAKIFIPIVNKDGEIGKLLSNSAQSKNLFLLENEQYYSEINKDIKMIDPIAWYAVELNKELRDLGIMSLEYCVDNNSRPQIRLAFNGKLGSKEIKSILENALLKPKEKDKLKERLESIERKGQQIEYTGSGFTLDIKKSLSPVLIKHYQ